MNSLLLLLLDSRAPAGGHNHSGGMEPAITAGLVENLADAESFCALRLRTSGRVAAAFAAAACELAGQPVAPAKPWAELDAELDARTPSEAMRGASRQLGRGLLRLVHSVMPDFAPPWDGAAPHHPLVLGAAVAAAGGPPVLAARAAALGAISAPASAAVRLLGLDPFAVHAMLARFGPAIDAEAAMAAASATAAAACHDPAALAADSAPALDLLADVHLTAEVRLFAS